MGLLIAGIVIWAGVHFIPSLTPNLRETLIAKFGKGYRALFSASIALGIVLIVMGWKSISPEYLYEPITDASQVTGVMMIIVFYLLGAAKGPSNVKRYIRHPMLTGVMLWGVAHLLANGDNRSVVLFGGIALWAALQMLVINKREGAYVPPEPVSLKKDIIKFAVAIVIYTIVVFSHPYFTGVTVMAV